MPILSNFPQPTEMTTNKVTEITSSSTDTQYPSAKAVYDFVNGSIPTAVLEDCSWSQISQVSALGIGGAVFDIGDTKSVAVSGTVGTLALDTTLYVFILGFNHNAAIEGSGISFGCFKSAGTNGKDVVLVDSKYGSYSRDGTKYFNMNHWTSGTGYGFNYGGWKGCDLRYDILGSTKTQPSGYGSEPTASRVGYDAATNTATSPVSNTLMAALPSDLRAVMKPITKYTDNVGGGAGDGVAANVSSSVDYLPLLSEYEVFGDTAMNWEYEGEVDDWHCANSAEYTYQKQYDYYANGNSTVRRRHTSSSTAHWWERSPNYYYSGGFCGVGTDGSPATAGAAYSDGVAPAFLV